MIAAPDPLAIAWTAVSRTAGAAGCPVALVEGDSAPWWSATFAGDAVWLTIAADASPAFDRWRAALPDAEWSIPDRLVADCAVDEAEGATIVSLLLLALD